MLLCYAVTFNLLPTFLKTMQIQRTMFSHVLHGCEMAVFSDKRLRLKPLCPGTTLHDEAVPDVWIDGQLNYSRLRNAALAYAEKTEHDWMMSLDSDGVLIKMPTHWPESGAMNMTLRQLLPGQSVEEAIKNGTHWKAWFVLHRKVFTRFKFDEDFIGYGPEDREYCSRIQREGVAFDHNGTGQCLHIAHPIGDHSKCIGNNELEASKNERADAARFEAMNNV